MKQVRECNERLRVQSVSPDALLKFLNKIKIGITQMSDRLLSDQFVSLNVVSMLSYAYGASKMMTRWRVSEFKRKK